MCRFGAASYVPALTLEKPLYARERADGLYKPITYLLFHFFDELFITVFSSLASCAFVWYIVDLQARPCALQHVMTAAARRQHSPTSRVSSASRSARLSVMFSLQACAGSASVAD
jgi:hypothetical protein